MNGEGFAASKASLIRDSDALLASVWETVSSILMEHACRALVKLTTDAENTKAAGRGGGVEAVISVLRIEPENTTDNLMQGACVRA